LSSTPDTNEDTVVDTHAHFFPPGLGDWAERTGDDRWPSLHVDAPADGSPAATGRIQQGPAVFREVTRTLWDVETRLASLDANGVSLQLVSPVPVMLTYWAEGGPALAFAAAVNDGIAAAVAGSGGRLDGLGTVPLQDVDLAVRELHRVVTDLGLAGVQIGTRVAGRELDDPVLAPFFEAAADLDAAVFVHPLDGGADAIRRTGQPYDFGLGMLTDTAMAATALVAGGVIARHPELRIGLAHGCGTMTWAAPRLRLASRLWGDPELHAAFDELVGRLWVDTLVFDPAHLPLLIHRFGAGHVMVGTDAPFIAGQMEGVRDLVAAATAGGALSDADRAAILSANGRAFMARRR
jgi:aminocarboxymuconate-semialdehyde decarboxylase